MITHRRRTLALALALVVAACGSFPAPPTQPSADSSAPASALSPATAPTVAASAASASSAPAAPAAAAGGTFAFPYAAGTVATPGDLRLHDDNFGYLDDRTSGAAAGTGYTLTGAGLATDSPPGVGDASLDLIAAAGTPVLPIAAGTVLASSPYCQAVLVDHGGGTWVEYVHIAAAVAAGQPVTRSTTLGRVEPALGDGVTGPCGLKSTAPHVHIAFLAGAGTSGHYVSMLGRVLCGHAVTVSGGIDGISSGPGQSFKVPSCPGDTAPPLAPAVTASWILPKAGTTLTTVTLRLSAKAALNPAPPSVAKVTFTVTWGSTTKTACTATKASGGTWACTADVWKLGAPLGKLALSFDVTSTTGKVTKAPATSRTVTFATTTAVTLKVPLVACPTSYGTGEKAKPLPASETVTVPAGVAKGVAVYATNYTRLLGPRGWRCAATLGVDGSGGMSLRSRTDAASQIILGTSGVNQTSAEWMACAYFAAARRAEAALGVICPDPKPPSSEVVTRRSASFVFLVDPARVKGSLAGSGGVYRTVGGIWYAGGQSAQVVGCALPSASGLLCAAIVADWQRRVGR